MTDQQHTVILGDGSLARFSTPERAAEYAQARRAIARDEALHWLATGVMYLAALCAAIKAGVMR